LAAQPNGRKSIRALLGRGASTDIPNKAGVRVADLIVKLNHRAQRSLTGSGAVHMSSSPFGPDDHFVRPRPSPIAEDDEDYEDEDDDKPVDIDLASNDGDLFVTPNGAHLQSSLPPAPPQPLFQSAVALSVQSCITPLLVDKFNHLAQGCKSELAGKAEAECDTRRIFANTEAELETAQQHLAKAQHTLEDKGSGTANDGLEDLDNVSQDHQLVPDRVRQQNDLLMLADANKSWPVNGALNGDTVMHNTDGTDTASQGVLAAELMQLDRLAI